MVATIQNSVLVNEQAQKRMQKIKIEIKKYFPF